MPESTFRTHQRGPSTWARWNLSKSLWWLVLNITSLSHVASLVKRVSIKGLSRIYIHPICGPMHLETRVVSQVLSILVLRHVLLVANSVSRIGWLTVSSGDPLVSVSLVLSLHVFTTILGFLNMSSGDQTHVPRAAGIRLWYFPSTMLTFSSFEENNLTDSRPSSESLGKFWTSMGMPQPKMSWGHGAKSVAAKILFHVGKAHTFLNPYGLSHSS